MGWDGMGCVGARARGREGGREGGRGGEGELERAKGRERRGRCARECRAGSYAGHGSGHTAWLLSPARFCIQLGASVATFFDLVCPLVLLLEGCNLGSLVGKSTIAARCSSSLPAWPWLALASPMLFPPCCLSLARRCIHPRQPLFPLALRATHGHPHRRQIMCFSVVDTGTMSSAPLTGQDAVP